MKKQITIMLAMILALPMVLAIYGGENQTIEFGFETDNCTIVPNETEGIDFTFNINNVLIEPAINFVGEFNITCYDWLTKEVKEESHTSGGFRSGEAIRSSPLVTNEVITSNDYTETEEEINYESVEEEFIDEPKSRKGLMIIIGSIMIVGIIVLWISFKKDKRERTE